MKFLLIILGILYLLLPYDILPDFIAGLGWLDDAAFWGILARYWFIHKKRKAQRESYYQKYKQAFDEDTGRTDREQTGGAGAGDQNREIRDPYRVLGVEPNASAEEIRSAYRQLAAKYHPDKVSHLGDEFREMAEKRFKEIRQAYDALAPKTR